MTIGRNDPCPCGSGKKFKKCCLNKPIPETELAWRRQRKINEQLPSELMTFAMERFGEAALEEAWRAYNVGKDLPFDPTHRDNQLFMPWFLFNWRPVPEARSAPDERTIAERFLQHRAKQLDAHTRHYVTAACNAVFSFHEVIACEPGHGFTLRDILSETEQPVRERSASQNVDPGDIIFAKIVQFEGVAVIDGCASLIIPPVHKAPILALRKRLKRTQRRLSDTAGELDRALLEIYHDIADQLVNPTPPALENTDGEPLLVHELIYEIDSPRAVFDAVKSLAVVVDEDELLSDAEYDDNGELLKVDVPWIKKGNTTHSDWDNTVLGHLSIDRDRLEVEVNSEGRARKIEKLLKKKLAGLARYKTTVISPLNEDQFESPNGSVASLPTKEEHEALLADPDVQAQLQRMMTGHWEGWLHEKLPALSNETPLQASQHPEGREMLETLLLDFERRGKDQDAYLRPPIAWLRSELGL